MKLTYIATAGLIALVGTGVYLVVQNENEGKLQEIQANNDKKMQQLENKLNDQVKAAEEAQRKMKAAAENVAPAIAKVTDTVANDPAVKNGLKSVRELVQKKAGDSGNSGALAPKAYNTGEVAPEPPNYGTDATTTTTAEEAAAARAKRLEEDIINDAGIADRVAKETAGLTNGGAADNPDRMNEMQTAILNQPRIARVGDARAADKDGFVVLDEGQNKGLRKGDRFAVRRGTILVARITLGDTITATECVANIDAGSLVTGMSVKNGDEVIKFDR